MPDWFAHLVGGVRSRLSRRDFLLGVGGVAAGSVVTGTAGPGSAAEGSEDGSHGASPDRTCANGRAAVCAGVVVASGAEFTMTTVGSALADVFTVSPTELRGVWRSTALVGSIPGIGTAVLTYQRPAESTFSVTSNQPSGQPFYPARATQRLFYTLQILDQEDSTAATWMNLKPMRMEADIDAIPPNGTEFTVTEDVTFYDTSQDPPEPQVVVKKGSSGQMADLGGLTVTLQDLQINRSTGQFSLNAVIATSPGRTPPASFNWFVAGYGTTVITSALFALDVPGPGATVPVTGAFTPHSASTGLVVNAFSSGEWEGHRALVL